MSDPKQAINQRIALMLGEAQIRAIIAEEELRALKQEQPEKK